MAIGLLVRSIRTLLALFVLLLPSVSSAASSIMVVRVGDGSIALSNASTPVFIEERDLAGSLLRTIPLPTVASGPNSAFALSGTAGSEGELARSVNGLFVTLAGYAASPGVPSISATASSVTNRVVARIDAAGTIDVSTHLDAAFSGNNVRGAVTGDGTAFWVSGSGISTGGGIHYVPLGSTGSSTNILANPANARWVGIFNGQLYGTSASGTFTNVFMVGTGLPTTSGQIATSLPGFPTSGASPYGFAINPAGNVCYVADDRASALGGGVQKWTFDGVTWTLATTFTSGLGTGGARGLCVDWSDALPRIYATTTSSPNQVILYVDDGISPPTGTVLATAPTNTVFRGIALSAMATAVAVPQSFGPALELLACPLPCRRDATVRYTLPAAGRARLEVFDVLGRRVEELVDEEQTAGFHEVELRTGTQRQGVFFVRLRLGSRSVMRKILRFD